MEEGPVQRRRNETSSSDEVCFRFRLTSRKRYKDRCMKERRREREREIGCFDLLTIVSEMFVFQVFDVHRGSRPPECGRAAPWRGGPRVPTPTWKGGPTGGGPPPCPTWVALVVPTADGAGSPLRGTAPSGALYLPPSEVGSPFPSSLRGCPPAPIWGLPLFAVPHLGIRPIAPPPLCFCPSHVSMYFFLCVLLSVPCFNVFFLCVLLSVPCFNVFFLCVLLSVPFFYVFFLCVLLSVPCFNAFLGVVYLCVSPSCPSFSPPGEQEGFSFFFSSGRGRRRRGKGALQPPQGSRSARRIVE